MPWEYFMHFGLGVVSSFLGAIPFGTVNLTVAHTTIEKSFKAAFWMALAASLVEIIHSFVAVHCGMLITDLIQSSPLTQFLSLGIFLGLGIYYLLKKDSNPERATKRFGSDFTKGGLLALINPQAIPFWVFVITYLESSGHIHLSFSTIITFLVGIALGKLLALLLFGLLSQAIINKVQYLSLWVNKIIGSVLIFMGVLLAIRYGFIG